MAKKILLQRSIVFTKRDQDEETLRDINNAIILH